MAGKEFKIKHALDLNSTHVVTGFTNDPNLTDNTARLVTEYAIKNYVDDQTSGITEGTIVSLEWIFKTSILETDPGAGYFNYNSATLSNINKIFVDQFTKGGGDPTTILQHLGLGDVLLVQQKNDQSKYAFFTISGDTIDNAGWWTIPVIYEDGGTLPDNNTTCAFVLYGTSERYLRFIELYDVDLTTYNEGRVIFEHSSGVTDSPNLTFDNGDLNVGSSVYMGSGMTLSNDHFVNEIVTVVNALSTDEQLPTAKAVWTSDLWVLNSAITYIQTSDTFIGLEDTINTYNINRILFETATGVTDSPFFTYNPDTNFLVVGTNISLAGTNSIVIGTAAAEADHSQAFGFLTYAYGAYSYVQGFQSIASGTSSHAEGFQTLSQGNAAHAEGIQTIAFGEASHSEGFGTTSFGSASHSEGAATKALSEYSHTEGSNTVAANSGTHAEGYYTIASGAYSHSGGFGTVASGISQTVIGAYNLPNGDPTISQISFADKDDYIFIIGNGEDNNNKSNAFTVSWRGNTYISSGLSFSFGEYVNEISDDETLSDESHSALVTEWAIKQYVDEAIISGITANSATTFLELTDTITSYNTGRILFESTDEVIDYSGFTYTPNVLLDVDGSVFISSGMTLSNDHFVNEIVTVVDSSSTDEELPTAKAVYDYGVLVSGLTLLEADDRYVDVTGDLMTGDLIMLNSSVLIGSGLTLSEGPFVNEIVTGITILSTDLQVPTAEAVYEALNDSINVDDNEIAVGTGFGIKGSNSLMWNDTTLLVQSQGVGSPVAIFRSKTGATYASHVYVRLLYENNYDPGADNYIWDLAVGGYASAGLDMGDFGLRKTNPTSSGTKTIFKIKSLAPEESFTIDESGKTNLLYGTGVHTIIDSFSGIGSWSTDDELATSKAIYQALNSAVTFATSGLSDLYVDVVGDTMTGDLTMSNNSSIYIGSGLTLSNDHFVNEIVTVVNASSTDEQLPTAKAVWTSDLWVLNSAITYVQSSDTFLELQDVDISSYIETYIPFEHTSGMTHHSGFTYDGDTLYVNRRIEVEDIYSEILLKNSFYTNRLTISNASGGSYIMWGTDADEDYYQSINLGELFVNNIDFVFRNSSYDKILVIDSAVGAVGIGTSGPSAALDVIGGISTGQNVASFKSDNANTIVKIDTFGIGTGSTLRFSQNGIGAWDLNLEDNTFDFVIKNVGVGDSFRIDKNTNLISLASGTSVNEIVVVVDENSTHDQLPTAKAVYDADQVAIYSAITFATSGLSDLYVNVTGDNMTGSLGMIGGAGITLDTGDIYLDIGDINLASGSVRIGSGLTLSNDHFVNEIVTVVNALSTDEQLPTAKAVWTSDLWVLNSAITYITTSDTFLGLEDVDIDSYEVGYIPFEHSSGLTHSDNFKFLSNKLEIFGSVQEGSGTSALGLYSHAEGQNSQASGFFSHAEGYYTTSYGLWSHVEGTRTIASGITSHAEGASSTAIGDISHAEGTGSKAYGGASHAEGSGSITYGDVSHAQGYYTIASGQTSSSAGISTISKGFGQFVIGSFNEAVGKDYGFVLSSSGFTPFSSGDSSFSDLLDDEIFVIGGGSAETYRRNIFTVTYKGNTYISSGLSFSFGEYANEISDDETLSDESHSALVTEWAIKRYVGEAIISGITANSATTFLELTDTIDVYNVGRILYESSDSVVDSANFTFDGTYLNVSGSVLIDSGLTLSNDHFVNEIVTVVNASSTDEQLPTAKAVWTSDLWVLNSAITYIQTSDTFIGLEDVDIESYISGYIPFEHSSGMTHQSGLTFTNNNLHVGGSIQLDKGTTVNEIVTLINELSTDDQLPTAKSVYDYGILISGLTLLEADDRYVDVTGDLMTGDLIMLNSSVLIGSGMTLSNDHFVNEIVTLVDASSTDEQLPTAKAVYAADIYAIESAVTFATSALTFKDSLIDTIGEYNEHRILFEHTTGVTDSDKFTYDMNNNNFLVGQIVDDSTSKHYFALGSGLTIHGDYGYALGYQVEVGEYAFAQNYKTKAFGLYSHAEGRETIASGSSSHAEGQYTTAVGAASHAEGAYSQSHGSASHTEGLSTLAYGENSHAEGYESVAHGNSSHAEGRATTTFGITAHAEGFYTQAVGDYSHAEGFYTTALGLQSHTEGNNTTASGESSHAEGIQTFAGNLASHVEGSGTTTYGTFAHAEGQNTIASGTSSHAEGDRTTASGEHAHSEGVATQAVGANSHAEGGATFAIGDLSHSEGTLTRAIGGNSHTEGYFTIASGYTTHTEGWVTVATINAWASHVEGYYSTADAYCSHAEGYATTTKGRTSHTQGFLTVASGTSSSAAGIGTFALGLGQTVIGSFNEISGFNDDQYYYISGITDYANLLNSYAFIIGGGSGYNHRKNAFGVTYMGNVDVTSGITLGLGDYANEFSNDSGLTDSSKTTIVSEWAIKKYIDETVSSGVSANITYTNTDPVPEDIGGIEAGQTFNNVTLQDMWTDLLYPYQEPSFNNFYNNYKSNYLEVGETLAAGLITFTYGVTNHDNANDDISITDITNSVTLAENMPAVAGPSITGITVAYSIQKTTAASHTWRISGTNSESDSYTRNTTRSWRWRFYWGNAPMSGYTGLTSTDILNLDNSGLTTSVARNIDYAAVNPPLYKYYCFPDDSSFSLDNVTLGGFDVGMAGPLQGYDDGYDAGSTRDIYYKIVSHTNTYGVTKNYKVFRTNQELGGEITLVYT